MFIGVIGLLALADLTAWAVLWNAPNPISAALVGPPPPQAEPLPASLFVAPATQSGMVPLAK